MEQAVYYDVAASLVCVFLIVSLLLRKLTKGRNNLLFLAIVVMMFITSTSDVINNSFGIFIPQNAYNVAYQYICMYIYYFVRNSLSPLYIIYLSSYFGLWHIFKKKKFLFWIFMAPYLVDVVMLIVNMRTHWVFGISDEAVYYRGDYITVLYIVAFVYFILCTAYCIIHRKKIQGLKFWVLVSYAPISGAAVLVQFLRPAMQIEVIVTAIMTVLVSISVQRPEESSDQLVKAFSYGAYVTGMKKYFASKRPMSVLLIKVTNHNDLRINMGIESYSIILRTLSEKMTKIAFAMGAGAEVYFLDRGSFALVSDDDRKEVLADVGRLLMAFLQEPINLGDLEIKVDAKIVLVSVPDDISERKQFMNFSQTFAKKLPDSDALIVLSKYSGTKDFKIKANIDTIISNALDNYSICMYYQPIYSVKKKKFVSAEALIRLYDDAYGFISPAIFIPVAEENGAIHQIGDFVLENVFSFIGELDFKELGLDYFELNLSVAQCIEPDLVERIQKYLDKYKISPEKVNFEITETAVDYDPKVTDDNIERLSSLGFNFSLDDYGTGYSNVYRVATLPLNIVKIDKSMVDEMDNPKMWVVIENTVRMLKKLDKKILVEGIEDKRSLDRFVELGVDYIQGYYFSKPLSESKYIDFVKEHNK